MSEQYCQLSAQAEEVVKRFQSGQLVSNHELLVAFKTLAGLSRAINEVDDNDIGSEHQPFYGGRLIEMQQEILRRMNHT